MRIVQSVLAAGLALALSGCAGGIAPQPFVPFANGQDWMLANDLTYEVDSTGTAIVVPAGFVTDYASTPSIIWSELPPFGQYMLAAVVHDYLYWSQGCQREEADNLFLRAMVESGVPYIKAWGMYEAVRVWGENAWRQNETERSARLPRIIAPEHRHFPANVTWPQYRRMLKDKHVVLDRKPTPQPSYCSAPNPVG